MLRLSSGETPELPILPSGGSYAQHEATGSLGASLPGGCRFHDGRPDTSATSGFPGPADVRASGRSADGVQEHHRPGVGDGDRPRRKRPAGEGPAKERFRRAGEGPAAPDRRFHVQRRRRDQPDDPVRLERQHAPAGAARSRPPGGPTRPQLDQAAASTR